MSEEKNFVSCVIYLHNDENKVKEFLTEINSLMSTFFEKYEVICVDDASADETIGQIKEYQKECASAKMISLVNMSYYQGIEVAMNAGRDLAVGDYIFEFDRAFMDYSPSLIMDVYHKALEGYDIVAASPTKYISLSSKIFYLVYNWGSRLKHKLEQERFRLISRRAINRTNQLNTFIPYRKAMYMNSGLKVATIHYDNEAYAKRNINKEEWGNRSVLAFDSIIMFTDVFERISLFLSGVFLAIMVFMGCYLIYSVFATVRPVEGWLSLMGLISVGFFGLFLLLTFVLKYLSVILSLLFKRQHYVIEGIEKL